MRLVSVLYIPMKKMFYCFVLLDFFLMRTWTSIDVSMCLDSLHYEYITDRLECLVA